MIKPDGTTAVSDSDKAKAMLEPYSLPAPHDAITTALDNAFLDLKPADPSSFSAPITMLEIDRALQSAKLGAMGPDLIPYQFLRHLAPHMKSLLLKIFNICFLHATIPAAWKSATLLPILKPNKPPNTPSSYRPIALASCTLKTLEKIVVTRLDLYLETNNKIPDLQFGFRKGRGCAEALDALITDIKLAFSTRKVVVCAFMDIRKAFDLTRHEAIRAALRKLQVPSRLYAFCCEYLKDRTLNMTIGATTETQSLNIGVPQGGPLSASLFSTVMCHVLPPSDDRTTSGLYADDTRLHAANMNLCDAVLHLNAALNLLHRNSLFWGVDFDPQKSRIIVFCPPRRKVDTSTSLIVYNNMQIPIIDHHKFLGLTFDSALNWKCHIKQLAHDCQVRLRLLKSVSFKRWGYKLQSLRALYISLIRAKIQYSLVHVGACSATALHPLEVIQNKALRIMLALPQSTAIASMEILANLPPLKIFLQEEQVKLTFKLLAHADVSVFSLLHRRLVPLWRSGPPTTHIGLRILDDLGAISLIHHVAPLPRISKNFAWQPNRYTFNLDWLTSPKSDQNPAVLLQLTREQVHQLTDCQFYTDGALDPSTGNNGIGIYCSDRNLSIQQKLPPGASIFTVELTAIWIAICWAIAHDITDLHIISDSLSALTAIKNHTLLNDIIQRIYCLAENVHISFLWVPSHIGLPGNDIADHLASSALQHPTLPASGLLPYNDLVNIAKAKLRSTWNNDWTNGHTGRFLHAIFPATDKVPDFSSIPRADLHLIHSLATNRIYLHSHLHLLEKTASNLCTTCNVPEDTPHFLLSCVCYTQQRFILSAVLQTFDLPLTACNLLGGANVPLSTHAVIFNALSEYVRTTVGFKRLLGLRKD